MSKTHGHDLTGGGHLGCQLTAAMLVVCCLHGFHCTIQSAGHAGRVFTTGIRQLALHFLRENTDSS